MHFFFGDDSRQESPTRDRMGPLIAAGGVLVAGNLLGSLERELDRICVSVGFPRNEEFKWSPGREKWMRQNLVADARKEFFLEILRAAHDHEVKCLVVINETSCRTATNASTHDEDVTITLLERIHHRIPSNSDGCVVIVDRPSGDRSDEDRFLFRCLEQIQSGTTYVKHNKIVLNVLSTPSKLVRTLQLADLVTSCCTARISGEAVYSPPIFEKIISLCPEEFGRKGGTSFKIHPDFKYANLYHWILGDSHFVRFQNGWPLPFSHRPYCQNENVY
jgi:hypothetical protein